jgi:hypothetical protein
MKNTKVIAAFPACGKTYYFENKKEGCIVLDSDSSQFSWCYEYNPLVSDKIEKYRNPEFPQNYINHIKENIGKVDYIFVSTHDIVRKALKEANIDYTIVFPDYSLKAEWIGRCFLRGSGEKFCQLIAEQWDNWMAQMEDEIKDEKRKYYKLKHDEFLSDAIKVIGDETEYYNQKLKDTFGSYITVEIESTFSDDDSIKYYYKGARCGESDMYNTAEEAYKNAYDYLYNIELYVD